MLVLKTGCGYGLPFRQLLVTHIAKPAAIIEMTSVEAIKTCLKNGMGLAILPERAVRKEIKNRELVCLNWADKLETTILMVWHKDKRMTGVLEDFMTLFRGLHESDLLLQCE